MVLALLTSGMAWNLSTWWLGLPVSSSHTLIGAILGIGLANSLLDGQGSARGRQLGQGGRGWPGSLDLAPDWLRLGRDSLAHARSDWIPDPELYVPPPADAARGRRGGFARSCSRPAAVSAWRMAPTTARRGWG